MAHCLRWEVASQGNTEEEAVDNLREAIDLHHEWPVTTAMKEFDPICSDSNGAESFIASLTFRQIRFKLENAGFTEVRQKGNHAKFVKREGESIRTAILPHYIQIAAPVLSSVVRQSGIELKEFLEVL